MTAYRPLQRTVGPMAQDAIDQKIEAQVKAASDEGFAEVYAVPGVVVTTEAEKEINVRGADFDRAEGSHSEPADIPGDAQYEKDKAGWDTVDLA